MQRRAAFARFRAGRRDSDPEPRYRAVRNTIGCLADRHGLAVVEARVALPQPDADQIAAAVAAALTKRIRSAALGYITSSSARVTPIARLVALCGKAGVPVLVDGAHGPAQVDLDLTAFGADWLAPKGCALLWRAVLNAGIARWPPSRPRSPASRWRFCSICLLNGSSGKYR